MLRWACEWAHAEGGCKGAKERHKQGSFIVAIRFAVLAVVLSSAVITGQQQSPVETPILPGQSEDFSYLTGRWVVESAPERLPDGRFFGALTIMALPNQIG